MKKIINNKLLFYIPLSIIMIISLLNMYNAKYLSSLYTNHLVKQIIWFSLGIIILLISKKINMSLLFKFSKFIYVISLFFLVYVLLNGEVINGARCWITFKGISFLPSELMKLALALVFSNMISIKKDDTLYKEIIFIIKIFILTFIPSVLVFMQPDTGAILFYIILAITAVILKKVHKIWYIIAIIISLSFISLFILIYIYNKDILINLLGSSIFYRVERIITFKTMSSYQLENALIGMGASSSFFNNLGINKLYIPEAPTDFIFAYSITNFGYITGFLILISYFLMDIYLINKYLTIKKGKLKYLLAFFISIFILSQVINIGMNLGLCPIIGLPLPFLSYGGSTLIIYFIFLALIFSKDKRPY